MEESDHEDEVSHIGGALDADGNRIMELVDQSDSKSEDDDNKLNKTKPVFILVSHNTHVSQIDLQRNEWLDLKSLFTSYILCCNSYS